MLAAALAPSIGAAFTLKTLVMPGSVIQAHAQIEEQCERCHETTTKEKQSDLCFSCHRPVRDDVASARGFHGRDPAVAKTQCSGCHKEHEGRDAKITSLDPKAFQHVHTDFPLAGAHAKAPCAGCHVAGTPYREAPAQCSGCHSDEDAHKGALGASCNGCHAETAWRATTFDHSTTRFPLTAKHASAPCAGCHQNQVFATTPMACASCHTADDVHKGRNGAQCGSCHTPAVWALKFDHAAKTGFALRGKHQALECSSCHVQSLAAAVPKTCVGCHQTDDPHQGKLGTGCSDCHGPTQWSDARFDHAAVAKFALVGAHSELRCTACHTNGLQAKLARECTSCHASDDPHKGQLNVRCETCHSQTAWAKPIRFDHDLAPFALLGKHAALMCADCHATRAFHDAGAACADCHASKDAHDGRFGAQCGSCHDPTDWHAARFDHDKATPFPLTGAHTKVACASCHQRRAPAQAVAATVTAGAPRDCGQCHRQSDPHAGRFGATCGSCHTTSSFADLKRR